MRQQRTLRHMIGCAGVGLHSGARVAVTLRPAVEGSGIRFRRVDRPGSAAIAAHPLHAVATDGVTSLVGEAGIAVRMVEHLMAAFAVCEIDNILVELSGGELPVMDGSALPFVRLMECAGTIEQGAAVARLEIPRPIEVAMGDGFARLDPAPEPQLSLAISAGPLPAMSLTVTPEACKAELVGAREPGGREDMVDAAEAARHCLLDALGGLALLPGLIGGRYVEHRADAALRCALVRALCAECGGGAAGFASRYAPAALRRAS